MLHPADRKDDGSLKLRRVTYADLDALLAAWRTTWGETARDGGQTVGALLDAFLAGLGERVKRGELSATTAADYTRCVLSLRPVWQAVRIEDVDVPMLYRWRDARGEQSRTRVIRGAGRPARCARGGMAGLARCGMVPEIGNEEPRHAGLPAVSWGV